ncbi:MAG: hypothetical protein KAJ01_05245, partial [Candidatus Hydrogenedentes bacterium]|nr:hypothetical protein [Candidatus Hydrogenedentota bacterium]
MSIKTSLTPRKLAGGVEGARKISSGVAVVLVSLFLIASSAYARTLLFVDSTGRRVLVDTENPGRFAMPKGAASKQFEATAVALTVTYMDVVNGTGIGFDDPAFGTARRETVELALEYLDLMLNETGAVDIVFEESLIDGTEFLATAGTFFTLDAGFTNGVAFDHITTGVDPDAGVPDIYVTVDFAWDWNLGSGAPSGFQLDLLSVLIHELTHGLGLLSLSDE